MQLWTWNKLSTPDGNLLIGLCMYVRVCVRVPLYMYCVLYVCVILCMCAHTITHSKALGDISIYVSTACILTCINEHTGQSS